MMKKVRSKVGAAPEQNFNIFRDNVADTMSGNPPDYVFVPPEVGPEIYAGSIVAVIAHYLGYIRVHESY